MKTTECWQNVKGDFGFIVQQSKDKKRYEQALGLNGEFCYVLLADQHSGGLSISIRRDKLPPVDFLTNWLAKNGSVADHRSIRFDEGGELGGCTEIHQVFDSAGYSVQVTAPDSSNKIGTVEQPHRTIASVLRTMLYVANLLYCYWPYALTYYVLIHNCLPHGGQKLPPVTICTGKRPKTSSCFESLIAQSTFSHLGNVKPN